jgi:polysaccharide export outer membrane protein
MKYPGSRAAPSAPTRAGMALSCLIGLGLLTGCAPGSGLTPVAEYNGNIYHLGVGDQVRVITYGETQLSQEFRIGDGGNIAMPLLGGVRAEGLTSNQLSDNIAAQLKQRNLLRNPSVAVEVVEYRPISVLGEVAKPGQYPYQPGMTMLTAVAAAGGFTYRAVENYGYVVRLNDANTTPVIGKILPQNYVKPGDVVKIYERYF